MRVDRKKFFTVIWPNSPGFRVLVPRGKNTRKITGLKQFCMYYVEKFGNSFGSIGKLKEQKKLDQRN